MASPCAKNVIPRWYEGHAYDFHVTGNNFDPISQVKVMLADDRAEWDNDNITPDKKKSEAKNLIFNCKVKKIHQGYPLGTLTITVTNQDGSTDTAVCNGTYDA